MKPVFSVIVIGFLSLAVAFNTNAHDSDRIDQLEKVIQQLERRLSTLEPVSSNLSKAQQPVTSGEGWRSLAAWRQLANGMRTSDVRQLLGEPQRLDGGTFAHWYYQNGGRVIFYEAKIYKWQEPRQ